MEDLPRADPETVGEIDATGVALCTAIVAGDARAAAAAYAPDAWLLPPYAEPARGSVEVEAFWRAGIAAGVTSLTLDRAGLWISDDLAFEVGHYRLRLAPAEGAEAVEDGSYLVVHHRRTGGAWLRIAEALEPGPGR